MAYNNNSYSGYNRGYSGGGQSRPPQRSGVEDKPAPSGGFQDRQLLISQTARPLSEK